MKDSVSRTDAQTQREAGNEALKPWRGECLKLFLTLLLAVVTTALARAEGPLITGSASGKLLAGGTGRVIILATNGDLVWEYPAKLVHDVWMLTNGNVLFADGDTVTEVTPDKRVVFCYKSPDSRGGGTYACQRLANGNTLVGENSTGKVLEVDGSGKVVFSLQTEPYKSGEHHNMRMARKLSNGNYLVCQSGAKLAREYTADGRVVWESKQPGSVAFAAVRTPKNTTLVSSLDQLIEYDASGKAVWQCSVKDLSGVNIRNLTGMHLLPNGNIVAGSYAAYKDGQGCGLIEITPERKVVWTYSNPKADSSLMAVQMLSTAGKPLAGSYFR